MRIPSIFVPDKDADKNIERLLSESPRLSPYNEITVQALLKSCRIFVEKQTWIGNLLAIYNVGERLADEIEYTKNDLEEMSQRITVNCDEDRYLGFYLSALANKIITKENVITLRSNEKEMLGIGACLKTGKLIVEMYISYFLGHCMEGGEISVGRNVGDHAGSGMTGGKITINGNAGRDTGIFMVGGDIFVYGSIEKISDSCEGRIFQYEKQVWPK